MWQPVVCRKPSHHPGQHQSQHQHRHSQEPLLSVRLALKLPLELLRGEGEHQRWGGGLMTRDNANYYSDYQERVMSLLTVRWTQLISPIQNIPPQPPPPPAPPARPQ